MALTITTFTNQSYHTRYILTRKALLDTPTPYMRFRKSLWDMICGLPFAYKCISNDTGLLC